MNNETINNMKLLNNIKNKFQNVGKFKLIVYILSFLFLMYIIWDLFFKIGTYTTISPPKNESNPAYADSISKQTDNLVITEGEKKSNNKKSIKKNNEYDTVFFTYIVKKSESLAKIAKQFNVKTVILKRINGFENEYIQEKQKIKIPLQTRHRVTKRETINTISQKYNVKKEIIMKANKISSDKDLRIGRKLFIPFP